MIFIAIGPHCWAKAGTEAEAIRLAAEEGGYNLRNFTYVLYTCEDGGAFVDEMGCKCYKRGSPFQEVRRVIRGKEVSMERGEEPDRGTFS